jgi:hypothetical protein
MDLINLQTENLLRGLLTRTLYYIILFPQIFLFLIFLSFHVRASRRISQNVHKNIILFIYDYYITLKHRYQYLGLV